MYAEPTMPNTFFTPCATSVSTNASDGVIFWRPVTGSGMSRGLFTVDSSWFGLVRAAMTWRYRRDGPGASIADGRPVFHSGPSMTIRGEIWLATFQFSR